MPTPNAVEALLGSPTKRRHPTFCRHQEGRYRLRSIYVQVSDGGQRMRSIGVWCPLDGFRLNDQGNRLRLAFAIEGLTAQPGKRRKAV